MLRLIKKLPSRGAEYVNHRPGQSLSQMPSSRKYTQRSTSQDLCPVQYGSFLISEPQFRETPVSLCTQHCWIDPPGSHRAIGQTSTNSRRYYLRTPNNYQKTGSPKISYLCRLGSLYGDWLFGQELWAFGCSFSLARLTTAKHSQAFRSTSQHPKSETPNNKSS